MGQSEETSAPTPVASASADNTVSHRLRAGSRIESALRWGVRARATAHRRHTHGMTNQLDTATPTAPLLYALVGTVLLAIGGMLFVNLNEDPEIFIVFTVVFTGPGLYLLLAGDVARGITLARR